MQENVRWKDEMFEATAFDVDTGNNGKKESHQPDTSVQQNVHELTCLTTLMPSFSALSFTNQQAPNRPATCRRTGERNKVSKNLHIILLFSNNTRLLIAYNRACLSQQRTSRPLQQLEAVDATSKACCDETHVLEKVVGRPWKISIPFSLPNVSSLLSIFKRLALSKTCSNLVPFIFQKFALCKQLSVPNERVWWTWADRFSIYKIVESSKRRPSEREGIGIWRDVQWYSNFVHKQGQARRPCLVLSNHVGCIVGVMSTSKQKNPCIVTSLTTSELDGFSTIISNLLVRWCIHVEQRARVPCLEDNIPWSPGGARAIVYAAAATLVLAWFLSTDFD